MRHKTHKKRLSGLKQTVIVTAQLIEILVKADQQRSFKRWLIAFELDDRTVRLVDVYVH